MNIVELPDDCLRLIVERLNYKDLSSCKLCCKRFSFIERKLITDKRNLSDTREYKLREAPIINWNHHKKYCLPDDIVMILYKFIDYEAFCPHCKHGANINLIVCLYDGIYGFISHWSGCLTYDTIGDGLEDEIIYAPDLNSLLIFGLTDKDRVLLGKSFPELLTII